ncbi:PHP domain-containing protein [Enterococcus faecium]|nr:PHP domain-containing protein [Enterococcus faecium]
MVGNKWYKCDLHIHSTASQCFQDKKVTAKEWVEECLNKGLDCVALTDHNTGENIDEYKKVAIENGLDFFPGVELTCGENGTHLLVLFDKSACTNDISDFLTKMGIKREDWASAAACSMKSVLEVIDFAEHEGLLVIPAHIDEFNGISSAKFGNLGKIFESENIYAVQTVQKEFFENRSQMIPSSKRDTIYDSVNARYDGRVGKDTLESWYKSVVEAEKNNMTFLSFSDNPHSKGNSKHGLWGIGTRYSYIKMKDEPDLGSLRDALMLGETRVHSDFSNFSINENEVLLEKLSFSGTTLSTKEVVVEFSDNLTSIIGGGGTGKSCITRFLVYVLGKEAELDQFSEIQSDYQNFAQIEHNGSGIFLKDTIVKLNIFYKGTKYQIIRTQDRHSIYEFTQENGLVEKETERLRMISDKVSIYSQKQIYEISKNQTSILELLDGYNSDLISEYKNEIETCVNEIRKLNWDIVSVKKEIQDKAKVELEIEDLKKQVEKLSHKSYKDVYDEYSKETDIYRELKRDVEALKEIPKNLTDSVDKIDFGNGIKVTDEIDEHRGELIKNLVTNRAKIQTIINEMSDEIDSYRAELNKSDWKVNYNEVSKRYQRGIKNLVKSYLKMN